KEYTINKDGSYDLHLHLIRKIMTYKGKKDFADFKFTYNNSYQSVEINKAQTSSPDGTVTTASEKEYHDIQAPWTAKASIYSHSRQKVINLPSVSVGASIEIEATLHSQLGFWTSEIFRLTNPIRQKIVSIKVPQGTELRFQRPPWMPPAQIQQNRDDTIYLWQVKDIPALTPEQMMPADENMGSCLLASTFTDWQQVAAWYHNRIIPPENGRGNVPEALQQQSGLDLSSVDKLYESLMQRTTPHPIDFLSTSLEPQKPETTIAKGHGTPVDIALSFYQLLKQQQIPARLLFVNTHGVILEKFGKMPSPGLLTNPVVRCRNRDYSFQQQELPPGFSGYEGQLALDLTDGKLKPIITSCTNRRSSTISLQANGQGLLDGSLHTVLTGQPAIAIRSRLRYLTPEELQVATAQLLHAIDPLASINNPLTTTGIDNPGQPVTIAVTFSIPRELPFAGGYYFLNLPQPALPEEYITCRENRRNPLLIDNNFSDDIELNIILPKGYTFITVPTASNSQLPNLSWKSTSQTTDGTSLVWSRSIKLNPGIVPADENYQQFRKEMIKLYEPESRMVIIKPAP
ncbi:MAG: DUF3857 domain-containing protein, partial [Xanthomonadaceae bacterium]|nr:DUF3857 domain-containing protein [Xanthomonadaceae bacterium]